MSYTKRPAWKICECKRVKNEDLSTTKFNLKEGKKTYQENGASLIENLCRTVHLNQLILLKNQVKKIEKELKHITDQVTMIS